MTVTEMPEYTQSKTAAESNVKISGNLQADKVKMTVSDDGAAHIMSLLTDLYSDPNLAVLREYSSNAIDSHKEVLSKMPPGSMIRPVEVSLPSSLSPNFIVQDFGTGMSTDDIRDIYSSYGKSTKQRDFNQIGAFGLGCKSALTLTQQFTINSVKDGQKTVAIISRGEDGVGEVNIVSSTTTTESNGVRVTIPIPRPSDFNSKVRDFFYTWESGTVLVDGKQPVSLDSDGYVKSSNDMFWYALNSTLKYDSHGRRGYNVILGGISYQVSFMDVWTGDSYYGPGAAALATQKAGSFYIEIPIGSVDLTPSREDIRYSPRTVKFLRALTNTVSDEVFKMSSEEIENAPTRKEALIVANRFRAYRRSFPKAPPAMWKGEKVPDSVDLSALQVTCAPSYARAKTNKYQISHLSPAEHLSENHTTVIVKVADATESGKIGRNAYDYMQSVAKNPNDVTVLATQEDVKSPWLLETTLAKFVDYEDFLEVARQYRKDNRDTTPREKSAPVTYKVISRKTDKGVSTFTLETVKPSEISTKAMYVKAADASEAHGIGIFRGIMSGGRIDHYSNTFSQIWSDMGLNDDDQIVMLEKNKTVEALNKRVKGDLKYFLDAARESFEVLKKSMDYSEKYFYGIMGNSSSTYSRIFSDLLILDKIVPDMPDPEIAEIISKYKKVKNLSATLTAYGAFIGLWGLERAETPEEEAVQKKIITNLGNITRRYPLLNIGQFYGNSGLDNHPKHVMLYMKAVQQDINERKS